MKTTFNHCRNEHDNAFKSSRGKEGREEEKASD